jgi:nicotinate-nucleotide pyrophosphorylase (carboxylating)
LNWDGPEIQSIVDQALREDVGPGDITSNILFTRPSQTARAVFVSKEAGVLAGLPLLSRVFRRLDPNIRLQENMADGDVLAPGSRICEVQGQVRALLSAERTALNFLQRLCGVATQTAEFARLATPRGIAVLDTRKTTPLLRSLEKYAVRMGGGTNHRFGLYDAILVKDNHLEVQPDFRALYRAFEENGFPPSKVEVEVANIDMLKRAIDAGGMWFLLDNMTPDQIRDCVLLKRAGMKFEVSGCVTHSNFPSYLIPGVDCISIGALTHSIKSLDISMEFVSGLGNV